MSNCKDVTLKFSTRPEQNISYNTSRTALRYNKYLRSHLARSLQDFQELPAGRDTCCQKPVFQLLLLCCCCLTLSFQPGWVGHFQTKLLQPSLSLESKCPAQIEIEMASLSLPPLVKFIHCTVSVILGPMIWPTQPTINKKINHWIWALGSSCFISHPTLSFSSLPWPRSSNPIRHSVSVLVTSASQTNSLADITQSLSVYPPSSSTTNNCNCSIHQYSTKNTFITIRLFHSPMHCIAMDGQAHLHQHLLRNFKQICLEILDTYMFRNHQREVNSWGTNRFYNKHNAPPPPFSTSCKFFLK